MHIRLKTNKEIKAYTAKHHGKWTKVSETSEHFGAYTTYYQGFTPILQHNMDNRTGKVSVIALLDQAEVKPRKVLDIN